MPLSKLKCKQHRTLKTTTWVLFNNICMVERGGENRKKREGRERVKGRGERVNSTGRQSSPVDPTLSCLSFFTQGSLEVGSCSCSSLVPPSYSPSSGYSWGDHRCSHYLGQHVYEQLIPFPQFATAGIFVWMCWSGCAKQLLPPPGLEWASCCKFLPSVLPSSSCCGGLSLN